MIGGAFLSIAYVTEHFSWAEFDCSDGTEPPLEVQPNIRALCTSVLEPIRKRWGQPLIITSGYRSEAWNTRVGGAKQSRHMTGEAADVRPIKLARVQDLRLLVEDMIRDGDLPDLGGIGVYRGWIHVDIRRKQGQHVARWAGRGVGSEETA